MLQKSLKISVIFKKSEKIWSWLTTHAHSTRFEISARNARNSGTGPKKALIWNSTLYITFAWGTLWLKQIVRCLIAGHPLTLYEIWTRTRQTDDHQNNMWILIISTAVFCMQPWNRISRTFCFLVQSRSGSVDLDDPIYFNTLVFQQIVRVPNLR